MRGLVDDKVVHLWMQLIAFESLMRANGWNLSD